MLGFLPLETSYLNSWTTCSLGTPKKSFVSGVNLGDPATATYILTFGMIGGQGLFSSGSWESENDQHSEKSKLVLMTLKKNQGVPIKEIWS